MRLKRLAPPNGPTALIFMAAMALAGCQSGPGPNAPVNALGGAGRPPGAIPSLAAAQSLDDADQAVMVQHFNKTMESTVTGQASGWTEPSSGYAVQLTPTRTYQQANGTYCRDFTQSITIKASPETTRGAACRNSDGTWRIVS